MKKILVYLICFNVLMFLCSSAQAQTITPELIEQQTVNNTQHVIEPTVYTLRLDEATVLKGYTFVAPDNEFKVGVVDKAVSEPITVRFKKIPDLHMLDSLKLAPGEKAHQDLWEFDLIANDGKIRELVKPIYVAIKIGNQTMNQKKMYYWNKVQNEWRVLPSSIDLENKLIRAVIHLPYARLALFDQPDSTVYEAWASWYPSELTSRNVWGCASNVYLMDSKLKVCRLDDLTRCVNTTLISRGPYVDGRVIDLTKLVFSQIGNPRGGILGVRVSLIE